MAVRGVSLRQRHFHVGKLGQKLRDRVAEQEAPLFQQHQHRHQVGTWFTVPADKRAHVVTAYRRSAEGALVAVPPYALAPKFFSAAGNVYSTPIDYLRFCQMLPENGQSQGLGTRSADGTTAGPRHAESYPMPWLASQHVDLGVSARTAGGESGLIGSAGAYGWSGGYNTNFRIDPKADLILMLFVQQASSHGDQERQFCFHNTVMQAIID